MLGLAEEQAEMGAGGGAGLSEEQAAVVAVRGAGEGFRGRRWWELYTLADVQLVIDGPTTRVPALRVPRLAVPVFMRFRAPVGLRPRTLQEYVPCEG